MSRIFCRSDHPLLALPSEVRLYGPVSIVKSLGGGSCTIDFRIPPPPSTASMFIPRFNNVLLAGASLAGLVHGATYSISDSVVGNAFNSFFSYQAISGTPQPHRAWLLISSKIHPHSPFLRSHPWTCQLCEPGNCPKPEPYVRILEQLRPPFRFSDDTLSIGPGQKFRPSPIQ